MINHCFIIHLPLVGAIPLSHAMQPFSSQLLQLNTSEQFIHYPYVRSRTIPAKHLLFIEYFVIVGASLDFFEVSSPKTSPS
jgi:hypothetical protein